jgi:hypothetical protein
MVIWALLDIQAAPFTSLSSLSQVPVPLFTIVTVGEAFSSSMVMLPSA